MSEKVKEIPTATHLGAALGARGLGTEGSPDAALRELFSSLAAKANDEVEGGG